MKILRLRRRTFQSDRKLLNGRANARPFVLHFLNGIRVLWKGKVSEII